MSFDFDKWQRTQQLMAEKANESAEVAKSLSRLAAQKWGVSPPNKWNAGSDKPRFEAEAGYSNEGFKVLDWDFKANNDWPGAEDCEGLEGQGWNPILNECVALPSSFMGQNAPPVGNSPFSCNGYGDNYWTLFDCCLYLLDYIINNSVNNLSDLFDWFAAHGLSDGTVARVSVYPITLPWFAWNAGYFFKALQQVSPMGLSQPLPALVAVHPGQAPGYTWLKKDTEFGFAPLPGEDPTIVHAVNQTLWYNLELDSDPNDDFAIAEDWKPWLAAGNYIELTQ